jgi:hypothetical protein
VPPPIAKLVTEAERAGRPVQKTPIIEEDLYVGYTLTIELVDGRQLEFDVTGAASRFADGSKLPPNARDVLTKAETDDAPPESGNFGGGYASSARQAARYRAYRRAKEMR